MKRSVHSLGQSPPRTHSHSKSALIEKHGGDTALSLVPVPVSVVTLGEGTCQGEGCSSAWFRGACSPPVAPPAVPHARSARGHLREGSRKPDALLSVTWLQFERRGRDRGRRRTRHPEPSPLPPSSLCERAQSPRDSGHRGASTRSGVTRERPGASPGHSTCVLLAWPHGAGALQLG